MAAQQLRKDIQNMTGVGTKHHRNLSSAHSFPFFFFLNGEEGKNTVSSLLKQPGRQESPVALPVQEAHL